MEFENPLYVSKNMQVDRISVRFWGNMTALENGTSIYQNDTLSIWTYIPPQIDQKDLSVKRISVLSSSLCHGSLTLLFVNGVISLILAVSLNDIWAMVNNL